MTLLTNYAGIKVQPYVPFRNNGRVQYAYDRNAITFCRISDISCRNIRKEIGYPDPDPELKLELVPY